MMVMTFFWEFLFFLPIINPNFTPIKRLSGILSEETSQAESR